MQTQVSTYCSTAKWGNVFEENFDMYVRGKHDTNEAICLTDEDERPLVWSLPAL